MAGSVAPNITTDGLILYLNPADSRSYSTNSDNWLDLSARRNNCQLVNGPTFSSENGGVIIFDGMNDYARIGNTLLSSAQIPFNIPTFTICSFINPQRFDGPNDNAGVVVFTREWARLNLGIYYGGTRGAYFFVRGNNFATTGNQLNSVVQPFNFQVGTWYCVSYVVDIPGNNYKMFVNNTMIWSSTIALGTDFESPGLNPGSTPMAIAARYGGTGAANSNIKMGTFLFYNRVLSNAEIIQNFLASKSRFGL